MTRAELTKIVDLSAKANRLDAALVCAVIEQESDWDQYAARYEPAFYRRYIQSMQLNETEKYFRATSWGLMQVMGQVAREFGYKGRYLPALCDPYVGIGYGCIVLKHKIDTRGGDITAGLLAYNGGGNKSYAAEVLARTVNYTPPTGEPNGSIV